MKEERYNNKPSLKESRRNLRNNATDAEQKLWYHLKGKKLNNLKFRRQHSFDNYILDFYCPEKKVAIELDGYHHFTSAGKTSDKMRDEFLNENGIRVIRFSNH